MSNSILTDNIKTIEFDALIVGGGGSGMRASLELAKSGLKTAVVSKVFPTRSHTVSAQGGITCAIASADPNDDWRSRYGATSHEQLELLDSASRVFDACVDVVYGGWGTGIWLDVLCAIVDNLCSAFSHVLYLFNSRSWCFIDYGIDQYHRHDYEYARPGHDLHEDAFVRMDLVYHSIFAGSRDASVGRCGNNDAHGHSLWHQFLFCCWWR